jgi:predicted transcriptional regulator
MRCADVMTTGAVAVRTDDAVALAYRLMKTEDLVFLPVCDPTGAVVGFVTEQHLTRVVVTEGIGPATPVELVMGRDVQTCSLDDDISVAERGLVEHPGRCAVCVGPAGELLGIIGVTDIARARRGPQS